ncbi:MAG: hypothetical protein EOM22_12860 [Gammaproteobacteria bacterium]|nr:hypothetical protein [Gammaproteobacteria bacterium]
MTRLRRFAPTAPAEWPWNGWPNAGGIGGRMSVEQVAEWRGMRKPASRDRRAMAGQRHHATNLACAIARPSPRTPMNIPSRGWSSTAIASPFGSTHGNFGRNVITPFSRFETHDGRRTISVTSFHEVIPRPSIMRVRISDHRRS